MIVFRYIGLNKLLSLKFISPVSFYFFLMRKFEITYVGCICDLHHISIGWPVLRQLQIL